jgi:hypothetical protein
MLKAYSKGERTYKSKWENEEERAQYLKSSKIGKKVPT